ncbi:MAG: potassium transporter TrkA [Chloroflexi bacterium]|nr:MAG: potassium transporter TrkA [Chloroflexota bacterium]
MTNILIVGGGKVGTHLATMLLAGEHQVRLIEQRPEVAARLLHDLPKEIVIAGNGVDPVLLESAGIRQVDVVAAVTGDDETNLVVTTLARFEFNVPRTIARVNNAKNAWMFTPVMGVDVAVNQADLLAHLIAEEMSLGDMMTLLKLHKGDYSLVEERVHPAAAAAGHAIRELTLPAECALAAVIRAGQLLIPHGDLVLQPDDEVLAVIHAGQAAQLAVLLGDHA